MSRLSTSAAEPATTKRSACSPGARKPPVRCRVGGHVWWCWLSRRQHHLQHAQITRAKQNPVKSPPPPPQRTAHSGSPGAPHSAGPIPMESAVAVGGRWGGTGIRSRAGAQEVPAPGPVPQRQTCCGGIGRQQEGPVVRDGDLVWMRGQ